MRLSILAGIHKSLRYLLLKSKEAMIGSKSPNTHFNGARPLDILLNGRMTDIMSIRDYLDAIRG